MLAMYIYEVCLFFFYSEIKMGGLRKNHIIFIIVQFLFISRNGGQHLSGISLNFFKHFGSANHTY